MRLSLVLIIGFLVGGCGGDPVASELQFRLAAERSDPEVLLSGLEQIKAWHQRHATAIDSELRPGLSAEAVAKAFAGIDCHPTDELKAIWAWHDGATDATPFVWYHNFLSLEDAISARWLMRLAALTHWEPGLIPVFEFEGEWYATYCGPDGTPAAPVVHLSFEDEPRVTYINLTTFVMTMAQAMGQNAVRWEGDAMVDDMQELHRIYLQHNPGYVFPYYLPAEAGNG